MEKYTEKVRVQSLGLKPENATQTERDNIDMCQSCNEDSSTI